MTDHPRPDNADDPNGEALTRELQRAADMVQVQALESLVRADDRIADAQSELDVAFGPVLWTDEFIERSYRVGDDGGTS
jgi:hypothetical protein